MEKKKKGNVLGRFKPVVDARSLISKVESSLIFFKPLLYFLLFSFFFSKIRLETKENEMGFRNPTFKGNRANSRFDTPMGVWDTAMGVSHSAHT